MTRIAALALSDWAHYTWLSRSGRHLSERARAEANADLLMRFPLLMRAPVPALPALARLPRPACAKVLRVAAALAHASKLRRIVSADARRSFARQVAPQILQTIQRDPMCGSRAEIDPDVALDILDRTEMTAAGLRIALRSLDDPVARILMAIRLPHPVTQRMARYGTCYAHTGEARVLLDAAYAVVEDESC